MVIPKHFLVVAAQKEELDGLFKDMKKVRKMSDFLVLEEHDYVIYGMIGGIGKVSMAYRLGAFLENFHIDEIINIGVAGSISKDILPLDTLIATRCCYHDVDVVAFGYKKGQMCQMPLYFECDPGALEFASTLNDERIKSGLIVSGDVFVTCDNLNSDIYENFDNPVACDMESAAVGQVAHMAKKPYIIIRTISDDPNNESNKDTYNQRLVAASNKAGELAYLLIQHLVKE